MELFQALMDNQENQLQDSFVIESLEDQMKAELLSIAFKKFTLSELEEKLGGNKFTL
jgi:hypothetical protein